MPQHTEDYVLTGIDHNQEQHSLQSRNKEHRYHKSYTRTHTGEISAKSNLKAASSLANDKEYARNQSISRRGHGINQNYGIEQRKYSKKLQGASNRNLLLQDENIVFKS